MSIQSSPSITMGGIKSNYLPSQVSLMPLPFIRFASQSDTVKYYIHIHSALSYRNTISHRLQQKWQHCVLSKAGHALINTMPYKTALPTEWIKDKLPWLFEIELLLFVLLFERILVLFMLLASNLLSSPFSLRFAAVDAVVASGNCCLDSWYCGHAVADVVSLFGVVASSMLDESPSCRRSPFRLITFISTSTPWSLDATDFDQIRSDQGKGGKGVISGIRYKRKLRGRGGMNRKTKTNWF